MPVTRKDWLVFTSVPLLFAGLLYGILLLQQGEIRAYKNRGIETSANVVYKDTRTEYSSGTDSNTTVHYFNITYMDRSEVDESESETSVSILDGEFEFGEINVGEFQRAEVEVLRSSYNEIDVGDEVSVLYLPNSPDEAKLTNEVLSYSPTVMLILIGVCGLGVLYCLIRAMMAPSAAPSANEFEELYPQS